jgi:N-acetyl-anhydromuramyl-L-alanine amidase AmpD
MKKNELLEKLYTSRMCFSNLKNRIQKYKNMIFDKSKSMIKEDDNISITLENKTNYEVNFNEQDNSLPTGSLFYPKAERTNINLINRGNYEGNYPVGAVIHYTAGQFAKGKQSALDTLNGAKLHGYSFIVIAYDGTVLQDTPLNKWGEHAGESNWNGLGSYVSSKLVGIEICNAGLLENRGNKYYTWFNTEIQKDQVREIKSNNDNQVAGYFHKYSLAQEASLIELLVWLKNNNPSIFNVDYILGHDEVAGPKGIGRSRKQDPGGALSMTMAELRDLVNKKTHKNS